MKRSLAPRPLPVTPPNDTSGADRGRYDFSRREFVGQASVALLACALPHGARAGAAAAPARKVVVGALPWVYAAPLPKWDITPVLPQIFADYEYAGIDHIELMHNVLLSPDTVAQIRELAARHRVAVVGTAFGGRMFDRTQHAQILEEAEQTIRGLARLGGRTLGASVGRYREKKSGDQLDAQAEVLNRIMALAAKHGVVVNLHNHTYEVENDLHDLKGTLARVPGVKLGPDLNWLLRGKVDPVWFIRNFGSRIVFLHLRDQLKNGRWSEAMGEGDMDYAAIAQALRAVGFAGDAVIELAHEKDFKPTRPLRDSLKLSREFVRRVLGY